MDTAKIIVQLIMSLTSLIISAFEEKDVKKLRRVTDVLNDEDSVLAAKAVAALEREKARDAFNSAAPSDD